MPVLAADYEDLVGLIGRRIARDELVQRVPMMGGAYDGQDAEGRLLFEFFPNRPDLLSAEGLGRACRAFFDVEPGLKRYPVAESGQQVTIDASVAKIRPHLGFALVEGVAMTEKLLADLIEVQERLTTGPGRRRKKVAVGIHDAAPVHAPFTYKAVGPEEVRFIPLAMGRELTPKQILVEHEKGRAFADLLAGVRKYPLIVDRDGQVLSLPPIINGALTALTAKSRNLLVDVTGTDARAVACVLNILVTALAERGGKIQSLTLVNSKGESVRPPNLDPSSMTLGVGRIRELLGPQPEFEAAPAKLLETLTTYLGRMGHDVEAATKDQLTVLSPAYRMDLLHEDDLVEDVGIGYGFDRFPPRLPVASNFARLRPSTHAVRRARTILLGMGFTEVVTLTVTGKRDVFELVGAPAGPVVQVANPITQDQAILRPHLYTSLLGILRANKHRELPQSIFEVGVVVPLGSGGASPANELRACAVRMASRATFAECKSLVETFARDAGLRVDAMEAGAPAGFIPGRAAVLRREGRSVGFFGELHPQTLHDFELGAPTIAFEVRL